MDDPTPDNVTPRTAGTASTITSWRLLRLDDNGNEFEMAVFDDQAAALAARDDYERRGHKQTYFLQPCTAASGTLSPTSQSG